MRILLCLLLLTTIPVIGQEEIVVQLASQKQLIPVYISHWTGEKTPLRDVLFFDLNYNGLTEITEAKESARYTVHGHLENNKLTVRVDATRTEEERGAYEIELTGNASNDRRAIHELADAIQMDLFGKPGIAATRILYTVQMGDAAEVWVADYDGQNARQLTHEGTFCVNPAFLPPAPGHASGGFFYVSYRTGQPKIYMGSLRGGEGHKLTPLRGQQLMPISSPQRDQVAFISDAAGNPDLFLQRYSPEVGSIGKPRQIFAAPGATQATPAFSPSGRQIAFVSNKDGAARIYIMEVPPADANPKEYKPRLVTRQNRENTSPCWSPDGTKIAYCGKKGGGSRQIWIYDTVTGQETQLTDGLGHKENPTWAPDSLHLIFNSASGTKSELYMVNLNQPRAIKISSGPGEKRFPNWEPR